MNLDDLKSLLDGFKPEALLPEMDTVLGKLTLVMRIAVLAGPVILLVMGLIYLFASPKEANYTLGYRCYFGMGSVEAWRFTQRIAGAVLGLLGLVLTVVMLVITGGFAGKTTPELMETAVKCVLWEAGLAAVSCLGINALVAALFDRNGKPRRKKA